MFYKLHSFGSYVKGVKNKKIKLDYMNMSCCGWKTWSKTMRFSSENLVKRKKYIEFKTKDLKSLDRSGMILKKQPITLPS